ncbi:hypothetical protein PoB_006543700 [Plakobranchus ocellatus]|uniref:Uncharacterized protein n=1 Tax=Plakobranchus ocellatus TaxID=259542 RepID=A0AAV4D432_9GAST|nr:hypothetical protein PoB_006543700 [Plakobranchus ocellatus]
MKVDGTRVMKALGVELDFFDLSERVSGVVVWFPRSRNRTHLVWLTIPCRPGELVQQRFSKGEQSNGGLMRAKMLEPFLSD